MITREDIFKVIRDAGMNLSINIENADPGIDLTKQGLDSLDMASILFELESAFNISISDESISSGTWRTIDRMVDAVNRLRAA